MSVPFFILYCINCDAEWSSLILYGYFEYQLPDGRRISAERCMGWCDNCRSVEVVESFSNKNTIAKQLKDAKNDLSTAISELPRTFFQRLIWKYNAKKRMKTERAIKAQRVEINRFQTKLDFIDSRIDAEKCLNCGSVDIRKFDKMPNFSSDEYRSIVPKIKPTSYLHPSCGGRLSVRTSGGVRISVEYPKRIYDINGNRQSATFQCD